jgi:hypothetical protein
MVKTVLLTGAVLALSACATTRTAQRGDGITRINPASLAANPAAYEGREVEVVGLVIWEGWRSGLYQSYGAYCRGAEKAAIGTDWSAWPGVSKADNRRMVLLRGTFRNRYAASRPNVVVSDGPVGPGPLEPGTIVRWLSPPAKPCPLAKP